ncbi:MAG: hypothetical protein AAF587_12115 [Bacteroidota bacterium]
MRFIFLGLLPLLALILLYPGCRPTQTIPSVEKAISFEDMLLFDYQAGTPDWAHIRISHQQRMDQGTDQLLTISGSVQGAYPFYSPVDGGDMLIAGVKLPQSEQNPGLYGPVLSKKPEQTFLKRSLGETTSFSLDGNTSRHIPSFKAETYLPPLLDVEVQPEGMRTNAPGILNKRGQISIRWNADTNNPLPVLVWIAFHHAERHIVRDPSQTPYEEIALASRIFRRKKLEDSGHCQLSVQDWLADIPSGTRIEVGLARGTEHTVRKKNKSLRIYYRTATVHAFDLSDQRN